MSQQANLSCWRVGCSGELVFLGNDDGTALFECEDCGEELSQEGAERLASDDGPLAELAAVLLRGGAS